MNTSKNASSPAKAAHPAPASVAHRVSTPAKASPVAKEAFHSVPRMNTKAPQQTPTLATPSESLAHAKVSHAKPEPQAPAVTSAVVANAARGEKFKYQIEATGEPTDYTADGLPAGLVLDGKSGVISGEPELPGEYKVKVNANGSHGMGHLTLKITVL